MTSTRKSGGDKGPEPTAEELEFIYSRLERLSDSEILEDMQDATFPLRTSKFIKRCRKQFGAAKRVLEAGIKATLDPATVDARKEHNSQLVSVMREWIEGFDISIPSLYSPMELERVHPSKPSGSALLFGCLKEHLSGDELLNECDEWERLASAYEDKRKEVRKGIQQDVEKAISSIADSLSESQGRQALLQPESEKWLEIRRRWPEFVNTLRSTGESGSLDAFLRSACEPIALEGDTLVLRFYHEFHKNKIELEEYRSIVERKLAEKFGSPSRIRCVLKPGAKWGIHKKEIAASIMQDLCDRGRQEGLDGVPQGVRIVTKDGADPPVLVYGDNPLACAPNHVLEVIRDERCSLIDKWRPSVEPLSTMKRQLSHHRARLLTRREILIQKGILPGRCRACPDA